VKNVSSLIRFALGVSVATMLAGCGGPHSSIDAPGVLPQGTTIAAPTDQGKSKTASETVIYSFHGSLEGNGDGEFPEAGLINVDGTLYGTTPRGGIGGVGTVFSISPSGQEHVVYSFKGGSDGLYPLDSLIDLNGMLYGTTSEGGNATCHLIECGTVFAVDPSSGNEHIVYRFNGGLDGEYPFDSLIAVNGTLYGTTSQEGDPTCQCGTIFSVNPVSGQERVLHRFKGGSDGSGPTAGLLALGNTLYGTTYAGGTVNCPEGIIAGCGTVFAYNISSRRERVVHPFGDNATDGGNPRASLIYMKGVLYGTTAGGGLRNCPVFYGSSDCGTVFAVDPSSGQERVVHYFRGPDGSKPRGPLVAVNGFLYGTTSNGGSKTQKCDGGTGCGTVFRVTPSGKERVLHIFQAPGDGLEPLAGLISVNGALYGTTQVGGFRNDSNGFTWGAVFKISP
jgi:uncharacterized repeat protein (TIGR03803 family)